MQGAFILALTYSPPRLMGRQLQPFSPWHGLILEAAASPYIIGGHRGIDDLVLGIWVCSHSYADGWLATIDTARVRKWGASVKHPCFSKAADDFASHIETSFSLPQYWTSDSSVTLRSPYWWQCAVFAMRELRLTEAQAWDYPLARIACAQACVAEINGNKDLMSADDIKGIDTLRADEAKKRKIE